MPWTFSAFTSRRLYLQDTDAMPKPDSAKRKLALTKVVSAPSARGGTTAVLKDVRELILAARQTVAQSINSALVLLYWQIGVRIRREVLHEKRTGYRERIFDALSRELTVEFGGVTGFCAIVRSLDYLPGGQTL